MRNLHAFGRGLFGPYPRIRYYGAVSPSEDTSNAEHDLVCSFPCESSSEAIREARFLADLIDAQQQGVADRRHLKQRHCCHD